VLAPLLDAVLAGLGLQVDSGSQTPLATPG